MLSNVKPRTGPVLWPCHCGNGRFALDPGDRRSRGGGLFFFILGLGIQGWHMQLVSHVGIHCAPCDPVCENHIDASHRRSQRRPLRRSSDERLAETQACLFLGLLCGTFPATDCTCKAGQHLLKPLKACWKIVTLYCTNGLGGRGLKVKL